MSFIFDFYSSELERVEVGEQVACLRFSAAHVMRREGNHGDAPGYAAPLEMIFSGASWLGEPSRCIGGIADGWITIDGLRSSRLPLPLEAGPVHLELRLISGTQLSIDAAHVSCAAPAPDQFVESYAC
ncbi:hypothetical protein [Niveibacterium sp.]|uniref:hypothetical protein n=1 Tax=Niveibacterium sp. TaxID=2017444 RepID=UPI0035B20198